MRHSGAPLRGTRPSQRRAQKTQKAPLLVFDQSDKSEVRPRSPVLDDGVLPEPDRTSVRTTPQWLFVGSMWQDHRLPLRKQTCIDA